VKRLIWITFVFNVLLHAHGVLHGAFAHPVNKDFLKIRAIDHTGVWESIPFCKLCNRIEYRIPRVADAVLDTALASTCEGKTAHDLLEQVIRHSVHTGEGVAGKLDGAAKPGELGGLLEYCDVESLLLQRISSKYPTNSATCHSYFQGNLSFTVIVGSFGVETSDHPHIRSPSLCARCIKAARRQQGVRDQNAK
jgi:hypothetical protein